MKIDPSDIRFPVKSYLFCAAHSGQLTLKDGFKLDEAYTHLIKKISRDIVSKSKCSLLIAEEVRKIDKVLKNYVITRWNSILFMIRSVLKLSPDDFKNIRAKMKSKKNKTTKQQEVINNFFLAETEIAMLKELEKLLSMFEIITNEFQSDGFSSSSVYPCIMSIKAKLVSNLDEYVYTQQLRKDLLSSLNKRFNDYIEQDCFKIATFLEPRMGWKMFNQSKRDEIRERLKFHMALLNKSSVKVLSKNNFQKKLDKASNGLYITYEVNEINEPKDLDDYDIIIDKYASLEVNSNYEDPLLFWKNNEYSFPLLAPLAKRFLGVPASSASVERMFNISGHIFTSKRRRTSVYLYENLVFLKLNEHYLNKI
jgi:hypothetical protein